MGKSRGRSGSATQAPFLVVSGDLGENPSLQGVARYLDSLGQLADYAIALERPDEDDAIALELPDEGDLPFGPESTGSIYIEGHQPYDDFSGPNPHPGLWVELPPQPAESEARIAVRRLRLASPLEAVLVAVADDIAPLGWAVAAMGLLKAGLGTVMEWQRHRAELRQMDLELRLAGQSPVPRQRDEEVLVSDVLTRMHREASNPNSEVVTMELERAIRLIASIPLTDVRGDDPARD